MNLTTDVFKRMVDYFMLKLIKTFVGLQGVRKERGTSKNVLTDFGLKGLLFAVVYNLRANLAAALQNAHDGGLIFATSAGHLPGFHVRVHVASFPADESFIRFDLTGKLVDGAHAESVANAVIHKPCGLLCNADGAMDFVGANAVLAVHNLPHGHEPLIQTERRVFENGAGFCGELTASVTCRALPAVVLLKELDGLATATWAGNAIGPTPSHNVLTAIRRVRKVYDCLLQSVEHAFHKLSMSESA